VKQQGVFSLVSGFSVKIRAVLTHGYANMQIIWRIWLGVFLVLMLLSACGTKGPLYIPEQQYPANTPQQPTPN